MPAGLPASCRWRCSWRPARLAAGRKRRHSAEAHKLADQRAAIVYVRELIAAGEMDRAVTQLAQFVATHPDADEAARFLGDLYYRQGRFDRAEAVYRQLLARNPHDKETHNRLGVVYATQNHIDEAIVEFQSALPGTDSIRDLVLLHLRKGDLRPVPGADAARGRSEPNDSDIQEELGEIYETLHRPGYAILYFRRALDSESHDRSRRSTAWEWRISICTITQRRAGSSPIASTSIRSTTPASTIMGVAQIQAGRYDEAIDWLKQAHRLEPERPEAIVNFGYLADLRGDWKRAVAYYVQAISVNPYVPESYVNLGIDYAFERDYRARLMTYLDSQLQDLDRCGSAVPVDSERNRQGLVASGFGAHAELGSR